MAEARVDDAWNHTSTLLAMILNVNCSKKSDLKKPSYFHPFRARQSSSGVRITKANIGLLKKVFIDGGLGHGRRKES